jgi:hypothetical protein
MQYTQIDPHRFAFIKPGGLTQPLPVVVTTGPGGFYFAPATGAFDGRGCTSPPGLEPIVSIERPSRFFGAVGLANWAKRGHPLWPSGAPDPRGIEAISRW